jgi:hypothetical protein
MVDANSSYRTDSGADVEIIRTTDIRGRQVPGSAIPELRYKLS